jgi:hypothetical protein
VPCPRNIKWFDKPFDRLTVLSRVEGLTTLSLPVESLKVERVEGQITMIPVSGVRNEQASGYRFMAAGQNHNASSQ